MKRKILLALLTVVCAVCAAFGFAACGDMTPQGDNGGGYSSDITDGTFIYKPEMVNGQTGYSVTLSYSTDLENLQSVEFPTEYDGVPVIAIGEHALAHSFTVKSITIPDGIMMISDMAFEGCGMLTSVNIPDSVVYLGRNIFDSCTALESVTFGSGLTDGYISEGVTFNQCHNLKTITGPTSIAKTLAAGGLDNLQTVIFTGGESIPDYAFDFSYRNLASVTIPASVTSIGKYAFGGCSSLKNVIFAEDSRLQYIGDYAFDHCTSLESITIPAGVTQIGSGSWGNILFDGCSIKEATVPCCVLPYLGSELRTCTINGGTKIASEALGRRTQLTDVTICEGITSIGDRAFEECTVLSTINIPDSVSEIGSYAFSGCSSLRKITVPAGLELFSSSALEGCEIEEASIPCVALSAVNGPHLLTLHVTGGTAIRSSDLKESVSLSEISLCDGITSIAARAFENTEYYKNDDNWVDGVLSIDNYIIKAKPELSQYVLNADVATIADEAFKDCAELAAISSEPDGKLQYIGASAFEGCSTLSDLQLCEKVATIGDSAFKGCTSLSEPPLGENLRSIGSNAFEGCASFNEITVPAGVETIGKNAFLNCATLKSITVDESNANYKSVSGVLYDKDLSNIIQVPQAISGAVEIPDTIADFGILFKGCSAITQIKIGGGVKAIAANAFDGCTELQTVTIKPDSLTKIGKDAFKTCNKLSKVDLVLYSSEIGWIREWTKIEFANPDANPIYKSHNLYINGTLLKDIGSRERELEFSVSDYAFIGCTTITGLYCKTNEKIGISAFEGCSGLNSVSIRTIETTINIVLGENAFKDCSNIASIRIEGTKVSAKPLIIGSHAFENCTNLADIDISGHLRIGTDVFNNTEFYNTDANWTDGNLLYTKDSSNYDHNLIKARNLTGKFTIPLPHGESTFTIADGAFDGCDLLESIELGFTSEKYSVKDGILYDKERMEILHVPLAITGDVEILRGVTDLGDSFKERAALTGITICETVSAIHPNTFEGCTSLSTINFGNGVKTIERNAVKGLPALESVTIGNGVTEIGTDAFKDCSNIREVYINDLTAWCKIDFGNEYSNPMYPKSATDFYYDAQRGLYLKGQLLKELIIPDEITTVKPYTFYGCRSITSLKIHGGVTSIGVFAFGECTSLGGVYITDLEAWCNIDFEYGDTRICNPLQIAGDLYLDGELVTELKIPDGIQTINQYAFVGCTSITSLDLPTSLLGIGQYAFDGCIYLTSVTAHSDFNLGEDVFHSCISLETIELEGNNELFEEDGIFYWRGNSDNPDRIEYIPRTLEGDVHIRDGIREIFFWQKNYDSMTSITIPASVTYIDGIDFGYYCKSLERIEVDPENEVYASRDGILYNKAMTEILGVPTKIKGNVTIPKSVTSIGDNTFLYCDSIDSITFEAGSQLNSIGNYAFSSSICSFTLPESIDNIANDAFYNCFHLAEIFNNSSYTLTAGESGYGGIALYAIKVHEKNQTASNIKRQGDFVFYDDGADNVYLLKYDGTEADITLPDYGKNFKIYKQAFRGNQTLTSIKIPECVTEIGDDAFDGCCHLVEIFNESSLDISSDYVVNTGNWDRGTLYVHPKGDQTSRIVRQDGFVFFDDGTDVYLVKYEGNEKSITLPTYSKNYKIRPYAFSNNELFSVTIPDCVTEICDYAFSGCDQITIINIGANVTYIGRQSIHINRLIFKNTEGWKISKNRDMSDAVSVDVSIPTVNDDYLNNYYYWKRVSE